MRRWLILAALLLLPATPAAAQPEPGLLAPPSAGEESLTVDVVERRLKQTEASSSLDETAKAEVRALYEQALDRLQAARDWSGKAAQFEQMIAEAPVATKQLEADLALQPTQPELDLPADASLRQLETQLAKKTAELAEDRQTLEKLQADIKRRAARRAELPQSLAALRGRKAQLETELAAVQPPELTPEAAQAQRTLLQARLAAATQQILAEEKEPAAYEATSELLTLQRDLIAPRIARREAEIKQLQQRIESRSRLEKERQARAANREAARAHPLIRPLAEENAALAQSRKQLDQQIQTKSGSLAAQNDQLAELQKRFQRAEEKIDAVGLTDAVGEVLRRERSQLPEAEIDDDREEQIRDVHMELLGLQDRRSDLANPEEEVQRALAALQDERDGLIPADLENSVREVLKTRREYLDRLIADYESYFNTLVELDAVEREMSREVKQYGGYIDERILWIRSSRPFGWSDLKQTPATLQWLTDSAGWTATGRALWIDARAHYFQAALILLLLVVLFYYRRRLRNKLREIGGKVQRTSVAPVGQTLQAAGITVLIAALWPGLMALIGWRLGRLRGLESFEFASAVGVGLFAAAAIFFPMELLRQSCRSLGLAEAHFQWPQQAMRALRRSLRPAMLIAVPMWFIVGAAARHSGPARDDALGRLAFVTAMLAVAIFAHHMLRPRALVIQSIISRDPQSWLAKLRPLWHLSCAGLPIVLAALAIIGYYYTALQLAWRLNLTACCALALVFLNGVVLRWVIVARIKLARQQAQERLADPQTEGNEAAGNVGELAGAQLETLETDARTLGIQTRQLLRSLLALLTLLVVWLIWVDVLPALGVFDRIELWSVSVSSNEIIQQADDTQQTQVVTRLAPVTLADVCLAALMLLITLIATRNLPGMLEMTVLQRLPLDPGGRYAMTTVARYLIVVIGVVGVATLVGLSWTNVQWLVAAISVGLGFGLQEIFANFVSGLILLFERPIRVGDIVTVDTVTGVVSKIQMRATTITNWDRQEYVVPNKEFITGRLLNWTLTSTVNRITIKIGIAYGSDTQKAHEVLTRIVTTHPAIMSDPAPIVTFEGFGDSTLNFVVYCYLPDLEKRLQAIHELHTQIDREFRAAQIEMAFPQRDLHIRSVDGVFPLARARGSEQAEAKTGPNGDGIAE